MTKPEQLVSLLEAYEEGLTPEEIVYEMGFSTVGSVASAVSRARKVCPKGKTIIACRFQESEYSRPGKLVYKLTYLWR